MTDFHPDMIPISSRRCNQATTSILLPSKSQSGFYMMMVLSGMLVCFGACTTDNGAGKVPGEKPIHASDPLLRLLPSSATGIDFKNYIQETFELNITNHINTSNGGGVAIFDANNDGLPDLYFISNTGENTFYVNKGQMRFEDATASSGLGSKGGFEIAVTAVDINADGYLDLYVCRAGPQADETRRNKLYINNGNLTFTEQAKMYGLDDASASSGANFFDYDLDGDLDLYLLNYPVDFSYASKINVRPTADHTTVEPILDPLGPFDTDRLYRNDGPPLPDGTGGFKDVSQIAGIWNFGYGLSVSVEDFNRDGWPDLYIANDFIQPDRLYINNQDGTFTDELKAYFKHCAQHTMGADLADFDNDGLFDVFTVDMLSHTQYRRKTVVSTNSQNKYTNLIKHNYFEPVVRNVLQRNNGNSTFSDIACLSNVQQTDWSWSGLMADLDNDGWKDILVTNGYQRELTDMDFINFTFPDIKAKGSIEDQFTDIHDFLKIIPQYKLRNFVFRNRGDLTFEDKSGEWMTMLPAWSNGAATGDLDGDGDLDYVVNNIDDEAFVYENLAVQSLKNNYIQFKCEGPAPNLFGIGVSVTLYGDDFKQYQSLNPTRGIFSSIEHLLHFGLGHHTTMDSAIVVWPDGKIQKLTGITANQRLTLYYKNASDGERLQASPIPLFKDISATSKLNFLHQENPYNDFEYTFLLPWTLSDLGPLMATADVNQDGLTDVYIGNAFGKSGGLFIQNKEGTFQLISTTQWDTDSLYEDHGALFFDVDMDGDIDLLVISGGYESVAPQAWQSRLYINMDGNTFVHARGAIPLLEGVCMRAAAYDYDGDGDLDLFLGGRVKPGAYPMSPKSYVLRNDRNKFVDVTDEVAPEFGQIGMVTDLQFANIDDDPEMELIVIGEWMPVTLFNIKDKKLVKANLSTVGLDKSNGFWHKLTIVDLDGDGDLDLVTGNLGLNTHYRASEDHPIRCYAADYDQNGSVDPIITYYEGSKSYPLVQKDVLIKQIPVLKKKYVYYRDYASATIQEILTSKQINESFILSSYNVTTGWWKNDNGRFSFNPLPVQVQAFPVYGIVAHDFNQDGHMDIFMAGNKYGMEVETGRLDAGIGTYLEGNGKGQFKWIDNRVTGIWASGNVRDVVLLSGPQGKVRIIVSNNNDVVQVYEATH